MRTQLLLVVAIAFTAAARPQTPPQPPPQPTADTFFTGVEKFEHNATHVTRVENDHQHDHQTAPDAPRRLSTVYVFGYDGPGLYNQSDVDFYRRKLHAPEWNCKICDHHLKPGETIDACTRPLGQSSVETVVIEMRQDKLTFVHTIGSTPRDNNITCGDN